jgi:hypothetical protein
MRQASIKIYCVEHKASLSMSRSESAAVCKAGGREHLLDPHFLQSLEWMFCCECSHYWRAEGNATANLRRCPACNTVGRPRFYSCDQCHTTMVDFGAAEAQKEYRILPWGQPLPSCPGCMTPPDGIPYTHPCATLQGMMTSPRKECAFCAHQEAKAAGDLSLSLGGESGASQTTIVVEEPKAQEAAPEPDAFEIAKRLAQIRLGGLPMDLGPAEEPEKIEEPAASAEPAVPVNEIAKKLAQLRNSNPFQKALKEEEANAAKPLEEQAAAVMESQPIEKAPEKSPPIAAQVMPSFEKFEPAPSTQLIVSPPAPVDNVPSREIELEKKSSGKKNKREKSHGRVPPQRPVQTAPEESVENLILDEATLRRLDEPSMNKIDNLAANVRERLKAKLKAREESQRARIEAEMKFQQAEVLIRQIEEDFRNEIVRIRAEAENRVHRAEEESKLRISRITAETDARVQVLNQACEEAERRYASAQSRALEAESQAQNALAAQQEVERRLLEVEKRRKLPPPSRPGLPA